MIIEKSAPNDKLEDRFTVTLTRQELYTIAVIAGRVGGDSTPRHAFEEMGDHILGWFGCSRLELQRRLSITMPESHERNSSIYLKPIK